MVFGHSLVAVVPLFFRLGLTGGSGLGLGGSIIAGSISSRNRQIRGVCRGRSGTSALVVCWVAASQAEAMLLTLRRVDALVRLAVCQVRASTSGTSG